MHKKDIKDFTSKELEKAFIETGEPAYRARQVFSWIYKKGARDFDEIRNIPRDLKAKLNQKYYIGWLEVYDRLKSSDGTEKILFGLSDKNFIETVLIRQTNRKTLCLSTQVGCKFACAFCASGKTGFTRDLTPSEIITQILYFQHNLKYKITNYVFMGMGEPLDNYENVTKAIMIMNDPKGMNVGARRITVSTCGIIPAIEKLKSLGLQINLSVSLHAANNKLRDKLMPVNKLYPLEKLIEACENFVNKAGRIITIEYVLIKGINDSREEAGNLAGIAKRLNAKVNLIPYSAVASINFQSPRQKDVNAFMKNLIKGGVNTLLRESKGEDIQAACGQLAGRGGLSVDRKGPGDLEISSF